MVPPPRLSSHVSVAFGLIVLHGLITIEIETVERAATHSSIMFRSTRLGVSSECESGCLDSLAG